MLQESLGVGWGGGEASSNAKKSLAKAYKVLQVASATPDGLSLRTLRESLEECLKPEAINPMKVLGFRLAETAPRCMTHELWRLVLEACALELSGGSENAAVVFAATPVLAQIPLSLVLGFFANVEKDTMNRLRAVLTHEHSGVRACAISTLSKLTLDVGISISGDGLFAFPFESHEARVCCQQDVWTILIDCWKLIFQAIALDNPPQVVAEAYGALRMLFARSSTMAPFFPSLRETIRAHTPLNDVAAAMYKLAFPRIHGLLAVARAMPMKDLSEAALWLATLLYTIMERSGAQCPSVSAPFLEVDVAVPEELGGESDADNEDPPASTERVRVDQMAIDLLESWIFPVVTRRATLTQATGLCRAAFILLAHPLLALARLRWASQLVDHFITQCNFASKNSTKSSSNTSNANVPFELGEMLVKTFAWLSRTDCVLLFPRTTEALFLLTQEEDRRDLLQALMDTIAERVVCKRNFQILEALCALPTFQMPPGSSQASPRANGSQLFQALTHSLVPTTASQATSSPPSTLASDAQARLEAQRIVLRAFVGVLVSKKQRASVTTSVRHAHENMRCYMALLALHFQQVMVSHTPSKSLEFFQRELYPVVLQVTQQRSRLQLLVLATRLHTAHPALVSSDALLAHLQFEVTQFVAESTAEKYPDNAAFEGGILGGGGATEPADQSSSIQKRGAFNAVETLRVLSGCMALLAQIQPGLRPTLQDTNRQLFAASTVLRHSAAVAAQQYRILSEVQALLETPPSEPSELVVPASVSLQELLDPTIVFLPRNRYVHRFQAESSQYSARDEHRDPVTVTGNADPVALQVSHYQPLADQEDVVALEISCCNLTTWPLSDLEVRLLPIAGAGVVQCVDAVQDLKLRFLRAGETISVGASGGSSSLLPFGVLKVEKRIRVRKFTRVTFALQAVFAHRTGTENGAEGSESSIRLAPTDCYVVRFDAFFRLPQPQFGTPAFFQHCWQSAVATASWRVEGLEVQDDEILTLCQRVLRRTSSRILAVTGLLLDLSTHLHIALLTQTKWSDYVVASLTMSLERVDSQSASSKLDSFSAATHWLGVLEVRSTRNNVHEMKKCPQEAICIFGGGQVQLCTAPSTTQEAMDLGRVDTNTDAKLVPEAMSHSAPGFFEDCVPPTNKSRFELNPEVVDSKVASTFEPQEISEQLRPVESLLQV